MPSEMPTSSVYASSLVFVFAFWQCGCVGNVAAVESRNAPAHEPADEILRAANDRYATCDSYEDTGELVGAVRESVTPRRIRFYTVFDRASGGFVFNFADADGMRGIIWRSSTGTTKWSRTGHPEMTEVPEVGYALAGFTGIARGIASRVPTLLLRIPTSANDGRGFHREADENIHEASCYKLVRHVGEDEFVLWIDKKSMAVRRTLHRKRIDAGIPPETGLLGADPPYRSSTTIDYRPIFDRPIDVSRFGTEPVSLSQ